MSVCARLNGGSGNIPGLNAGHCENLGISEAKKREAQLTSVKSMRAGMSNLEGRRGPDAPGSDDNTNKTDSEPE